MKKIFIATLVAMMTLSASAQQVTTLYFLENAPMRHTINPAFQPVSRGFINFSPLGWSSFGFGNNSLTLQDVLFVDPVTGKTITPLHPNANRAAFLRSIRSMTLFNSESTLGLINMGFRIKEKGFFTLGANIRVSGDGTLPKSLFDFFLGGGMQNLNGGYNYIGLGGIGAAASVYTEVAFGYSHQINEHWTVGGKLKVLFGTMYAKLNSRDLQIEANTEQWNFRGNIGLDVAGPVNGTYLTQYMDGKNMNQIIQGFKDGTFDPKQLINTADPVALLKQALVPSGYGAAIDFGFAWKPIKQLQISAAITDLGFIYWHKNNSFNCVVDTTFAGAGQIDYNDPAYRDAQGNFSTDILMDTVKTRMMGLLNGVTMHSAGKNGFARMTYARLNVGIDANFWDNRIGLGIVSATRLYDSRLYEEITIGAAFRPVNWFNIAVSYSLMNNGKYSNIGAGLGFMPYDGINLTLALDYIPTSYAGMNINGQKRYILPDKAKMVNVALGFSICWGSNKKDKDHDGVWDKIDMCPDTPKGVKVDEVGCPLDEDGDGVPDYLDHCLGTPAAAIHFVDSVGCALDTDGDGVEDYKDECPNTPKEAWGTVDDKGCPIDTDGDGVPDYLDRCANTPKAAHGTVDKHGCPIDSDGDEVPDYLDECPDTPIEAWTTTDKHGCPIDSDKDGVPDYLDECPNTKKEALGHVDAKGCDLDTDGDGVVDYLDACPTVPGLKNNKGCPEVKKEVRQLLEKAMQGIEFETGKSNILPSSYPLMDQIAQTFIDNPSYIIEIQGHTDNTGDPEKNLQLSQDRADAVLLYLVKKGISSDRMTSIGYGQNEPIADNNTKAGRQKNRRVQFKISFEEIHYETILDHADPEPAE